MSAVVRHPRAIELVERAKLRKQVARAVSRLIAILDDLDGDPEAEPLLGAPEVRRLPWTYAPQTVAGMDQRWWSEGANDDREGGDVQDEPHDPNPDEPWLASPERHHDQRRWAAGAHGDAELVDEDGDAVHAD